MSCLRAKALQSGFSVVELLIVISIIGMLVSLTIPAVQASREAARRSECLNKVRQLGLAVLQYHDSSEQLPPSRIHDRFLTWAAFALPHIEQTSVAAHFDPMVTFNEQPEVLRLTPVATFLCPSRTHDGPVVTIREYPGIKGDYAAVTSTFLLEGLDGQYFDGAMILGDTELESPGRIKTWKSRTRLKDIVDGLSNTFLIIEASLWLAERASLYDGNDNPGAILGDRQYPLEHDHLAKKHSLNPIAESESQPGAWVGSAHPHVVIVSLADGSGRPVRKDADLVLLEHLVTRAGNETASVAEVSY